MELSVQSLKAFVAPSLAKNLSSVQNPEYFKGGGSIYIYIYIYICKYVLPCETLGVISCGRVLQVRAPCSDLAELHE